jgi:hypothetical protein
MAYKFYNIGKANEEITRLEGLAATHAATIATQAAAIAAKPAAGPEAGQLAEVLASNVETANSLAQANTDLATARAAITALNLEVASLKGQVTEAVASVATEAARKAAAITAAAGAPAIPAVAADAKAATVKGKGSGMARILAAAKSDLKAGGYVAKQQTN